MREEELLAAVKAAFPAVGDDSHWTPGGAAYAVDSAVPGRHFLPSRPHGWREGAWHALARVAADLAAVGASPRLALAAFALPPDATESVGAELVAGLAAAATEFGMEVVGGDLAQAPGAVLTVAGVGEDARGPGRAGGAPGDLVAVTGMPGARPLGWALALAGREEGARAGLVAAALTPRPPLGAARALAPLASAMMDLSDGLGLDLWRLAEASGVGFTVAADPPWPEGHARFAAEVGASRAGLLAAGGDHEYLLALPPRRLAAARQAAGAAGLTVLGRLLPLAEGRHRLGPDGPEPWERAGSELRWG